MKKYFLLILFISISTMCFSQVGWKSYSVGFDSATITTTIYSIDSEYLAKNEEGYYKVWQRVENAEFKELGNSKTPSKVTEILWAIDCSQKRIKAITVIERSYYTGKIKKEYTYPLYQQEWQDIIPGSTGEDFLNHACIYINQ